MGYIYANYSFRLTKANDVFLASKWIGKKYQHSKKDFVKTYFFTDRSIYRPGQTVYFKGIVLEKFKGDYSVKPGFKTKVEFYDVNYQKISMEFLIEKQFR